MPKATTPTPARRWTSLTLGAEHIGVSEKTLRRLVASGRITGYRFGPRLIRLDLNELDAMLRPIPSAGGTDAA